MSAGEKKEGAKTFKPSLAFLRKVAAGDVYSAMGYTMKRGAYRYFRGGEKTAEAHKRAGYIKPWGGASLGRRATVELTDLGRAALQSSGASNG